MAATERKNLTRAKIINYIINNQTVSKAELAKNLNLSMPTVLSNVNDLLASQILMETGVYESTGGRKAKQLSINPSYRCALGITITANHVGFVLVNLNYEVEKSERIRLKFSPDFSYAGELAAQTDRFLSAFKNQERILGVGISIPGIINHKEHLVVKSHALGLENYSLSFLEQAFSFPVYFENDANAAMLSEDLHKYQNAIYLSLNNTLGGAFCINGKLFTGQNQRAGEFGHMILIPGGKPCYCGKLGCADAYCSAAALTDELQETLDQFMMRVKNQDPSALQTWDTYLSHLAILISNLRMAYDMDIILGGEVGGYLSNSMLPLSEKVIAYNGFDHDTRYLKNCSYQREASAVGAAKHFLADFISAI